MNSPIIKRTVFILLLFIIAGCQNKQSINISRTRFEIIRQLVVKHQDQKRDQLIIEKEVLELIKRAERRIAN